MCRNKTISLFLVFTLFGAILQAASTTAIVTAARGTVLELDGRQQVVRTLSANAEVPEGHTIQTRPGATATIVLANGGVVTLQSDTTLVLAEMQLDGPPSMASYRPLRPSPANTRTRLHLERGEVLGEVKGIRANSKFEVTSAVGTAGISGTKFVVRVTVTGGLYTMTITNLDGTVVSTAEGESPVSVPPGTQVEISANFDTTTGEVSEVTSDSAAVPPAVIESFSSAIESAIEAIASDEGVDLPTDLIPIPSDLDPDGPVGAADVEPVVGTAL
jgi:hypothetical protein